MVQESIEQCRCDDWITEDLAPFCKATIGGQDHRTALVARVDELEEQVAASLDDRQVPDLVNDEGATAGRGIESVRASWPSRSALAKTLTMSARLAK